MFSSVSSDGQISGASLLYSTGLSRKKKWLLIVLKHTIPHKIIEGLNKSWEKMFQISIWSYFWPFCGDYPTPFGGMGSSPHLFETPPVGRRFFGGVGAFSPSSEAEFLALSESLRQLEELEQREGATGGQFWRVPWNLQGFFLTYTNETVTRRLVFSTCLLKNIYGMFWLVFYGMIFGVIFIFYGKWSVWSIFCGTCLVQPSQVNLLPLRCL